MQINRTGKDRRCEQFDLSAYQEFTRTTAIYPGTGQHELPALTYCTLGLAGEAGEVANKVKKLIRDGNTPERREAIADELGDVLWYWTRLVDEMGLDPAKIIRQNMAKLRTRYAQR